MIYRYPEEVHEFVKKWSPMLRDQELAEACNKEFGTEFTASKMKSFRGNHGYRNGKKQLTSEEYWKYQKRYPQGMYEFIRDNSWGVSSAEMARMVNEKFGTDFSKDQMKCFRQRHGIKSGVTGWYQKGHAPGNKGKKLEEYITDPERLKEIKEKVSRTQFKAGHSPKNEMPLGTVTTTTDGYVIRKISMEGKTPGDRWEFVHRAVWEEHHGKIPDGMMVAFRDNNKLNCDIDNLMLITKSENVTLTRKGYRSSNPEVTDAGLAVIRLKAAARKRRKAK